MFIHPNVLTLDVVLQIKEPVYHTIIPFHLNNLLEVIMLFRIYLLYNCLIESSIYCTPRANRMCRIYSAKNEANFGIKSVFNAYPLFSLFILFTSLVLILSLMLKLSEDNNEELDHL